MTNIFKVMAVLSVSCASLSAQAHIGYTGRNFGTIIYGSSVTISNQTIRGNYGWADASDLSLVFDANYATWHTVDSSSYTPASFVDGIDNLYFGDSHRGRAYRFHLGTTQTLTISATSNPSATTTSVGGLVPAFSVYRGLGAISPFTPPQTGADHDFAPASRAWRTSAVQAITGNGSHDYFATQGSWNALGDWYIGGNGDPPGDLSALSFFQYVGSAATTVPDGIASGTFTLGPGNYSIFVGGNNISAKSLADFNKHYGISLTVTAVPEPESYAMLLAGLGLVGLAARRRRV